MQFVFFTFIGLSNLHHFDGDFSANLFISLSINSVVAVLLDCQNNLSFHLLSSLTTASTSSPIANLQLPIPPCPYSSPRVVISDLALAAAAVGSNRVFVYQLWSGWPHVADSVKDYSQE